MNWKIAFKKCQRMREMKKYEKPIYGKSIISTLQNRHGNVIVATEGNELQTQCPWKLKPSCSLERVKAMTNCVCDR